jgi:hypothetical protein
VCSKEYRDEDKRKYDGIEEIGPMNTMNQLGGKIVQYLYELGRSKAVIEVNQGTTRGLGCAVSKSTLRKSNQLEAITRSGGI